MGGMGGGGDVSSLAQQIKDAQKGNPAVREAWVNYANSQGGGSMDPNRHPAEFLQGFITRMRGGGGGVVSMGGCGGGGDGAGGAESAFFSTIKQMQKKSQNFRGAWSQFCANFGGGKGDPGKHSQEFHMQFLDALAQQGCLNAGMSPEMAHAAGPSMPMMGADDNPAKRARTGGMGSMGGAPPDPGSKEYLVAQVKEFTKMGADQKELWCAYCDTYLQGTRDPNRQDASVLLEFCTNHGVPPSTNFGGGGGGGGGASWAPVGGGGGAVVGDAEQQALVQKVKNFQKTSTDAREQWYAFCGVTKDPSRHEKEKLQEFCMMHSL